MERGLLLEGSRAVGFALALASVSIGCTVATGSVQGGEPLFDAAATGVVAVSSEAGGEGGGATTNNPAAECQPGGMYSGSTWTDLYQCYFGPTGPDSCAGQTGQAASCHGTGGAESGIWTCGPSADSCYMGMMKYAVIDPTNSTSDPTMNGLYMILCETNGSGQMPYGCPTSAQFYPADMARIAAWIQDGGQNN
ncbi:MAG TPA: hypothetical protein VEK07_10615 [Polyangiaceae bacterium]|nr:hypothetical protein [Polyangiaceae bacterium]